MNLMTTDNNITIETSIDVESDFDTEFLVPFRIFYSTVNKLPTEEVTLSFDEKNRITIKSGNFHSDLVCFDVEEYPRISIEESGKYTVFDKKTFKDMISRTSFAASTSDVNGILNGILIKKEEGNLVFVAVDVFRIAIRRTPSEIQSDLEVVVPARSVGEVAKIISDDDRKPDMMLDVSDGRIILVFDNNKVMLNTLQGKFIDYEGIVKQERPIRIRAKREELINIIDRASVLSSSIDNNLIKLTITDNNMMINSLSDEGRMEENLEVIKEGPDLTIGFNSSYLKEILKVIDDEEILMSMSTSVRSCVITPLSGESYLYLVLPVRIN